MPSQRGNYNQQIIHWYNYIFHFPIFLFVYFHYTQRLLTYDASIMKGTKIKRRQERII